MAKSRNDKADRPFNVMAVVQGGRLQYEAVIFAASFRETNPGFKGRLILAEPQPGDKWDRDPRIDDPAVRELLETLGAEIIGFDSRYFGSSYPHGNKIEGLRVLPEREPFVFFDTDTLFLDSLEKVPFDFARPTASMRREATWPQEELYGPGIGQTWASLYEKFGLDFASSEDPDQPEDFWERYLYFNAGFFFGECPGEFGRLFTEYAVAIRDDRPDELVCQEIYPWLDQIALPLVIHKLGGGRDTLPGGLLDGEVTCHWRVLPLLYAREADRVVEVLESVTAPNKIKKVIKGYDPIKRMIYQGRGQKVRALFDRDALPRKEQMIRNRIKKAKLWMR